MAKSEVDHIVKFAVFADLHIDIMQDSIKRLSAVIDAAKSANVDFIINLGDLTYPDNGFLASEAGNTIPKRDPKAFQCNRDNEKRKAICMLKECGIPVYHVLGNHEADACTKEQSLKYIGWEKSYYSFDIKKKHFVVLDSNYIRTDDGRYVSFEHCNYHYSPSGSLPFVSQEQIEWLENDIVSSPYPTIIFSHHSLSDTVNGVLNRREIWQLFKRMNADRKRVILCMNGHSHIDGLSRHDDVYFLDVNSISNIWIGGKYAFIRYSEEIDKEYPYLKYTTPYRDPLYAIATLSDTEIAIDGVESEFVGPSPYELGMPKKASEFVSTAKISSHRLKI